MKFPSAPDQIRLGTCLVLFLLFSVVALLGVASAVVDGQRDTSASLILFLETREADRVDQIAQTVASLESTTGVLIQTPSDASAEIKKFATPKPLDISPTALPYRIRLEPAFGSSLAEVERDLAPLLLQPTVSELLITDGSRTFFHWTNAFAFFAFLLGLFAVVSFWFLVSREVKTESNRQWKRTLLALGVPRNVLHRNLVVAGVRRGTIVGLGTAVTIATLVIWLHFNAAHLSIQMEHVSLIWLAVVLPLFLIPLLVMAAQTNAVRTM